MTRHAHVRVLDSRPVASPQLPRLSVSHVLRPRLSQPLLDSGCRLSLLCAPAGFGKSALLNECLRQAPPATQLVWLDLLGRPLTPAELLARLALALVQTPVSGDPEGALAELLSRSEQPLWIVLNDYPRHSSPELDACLDRLIEQTPANLRWWVCGRRRPAWNLPRLLLQGDLFELDGQALAFDEGELRELLEVQRLAVSEELLGQLWRDSEGWPAGICLLLFKTDSAGLRERMVAGTPLLQEYLGREVLNDLPLPLARALRVLAHIPRFSAELCEQLLEEGGAEMLGELRDRQLFLQGLDSAGQWFRLWRPLALNLKRQPGGLPIQAHLRACRWFFQHGEVREAVEHALWAEQPEVAASYLQRFGQEQLLVEHSVTQFLQWRDELPGDLFASTPRLITLLGWALLICARLDEANECLTNLGRFLPQADPHRQRQLIAHWQALQGVLRRQQGDPNSRAHCLAALADLPKSAWSQRILCHQALTQQALAQGELELARSHVEEGLRLSRLNGSLVFEAMLEVEHCQYLTLAGEYQRSVEVVNEAMAQVAGRLRHGPVIARLQLVRAGLLMAQGYRDEARDWYQSGLHEAARCEDASLLFGYLGLIDIAAEDGDFSLAATLLQEAERTMQWQHVPEVRYGGALQHVQGLILLAQGNLEMAAEQFQDLLERYRSQGRLSPSGFTDLLRRTRFGLALCNLRQGQLEVAQQSLRQLREECLTQGLLPLACECRFALAEALLAGGRHSQAESELRRALSEAQRMHLLRPVQAFYRLQPALVLQHVSAAQRERLLQEQPVAQVPRRDDGSLLSCRELVVLGLIAQGLSNQEIAEQLFISLHTVKTHARRINSKLKVERRTQAVAQAKALGLIE
ncbi:LuxR C-terminal-related transcriptional regulator [Pseudomonas sp. LS44]|uniref:LuxR C-terminal-related transcriptional regulator n=1 Tax=Pseudomonas sp. LS44 TaxID=1357074 RepID=UPI00215B6219|nr:LuxR C-terminal-related transcriptional regulator [Pseudomonas sp. LS44]UVE16902.1 LuxR C-terminal-related transcriptional regulator [Pseudomonas sp. LS44]